jgi:hypothetical protein
MPVAAPIETPALEEPETPLVELADAVTVTVVVAVAVVTAALSASLTSMEPPWMVKLLEQLPTLQVKTPRELQGHRPAYNSIGRGVMLEDVWPNGKWVSIECVGWTIKHELIWSE